MTTGDILFGLVLAGGFFVAASVSRLFRRSVTGIIFGGVAGIAFSVTVLFYGLNDVFAIAQTADGN